MFKPGNRQLKDITDQMTIKQALDTIESLDIKAVEQYSAYQRGRWAKAIKTLKQLFAVPQSRPKNIFKPREDKMIDPYELKEYIYRLMEYRKKNNEKPHDDLYAVLGHVQILIEEE